ncbi:MAG: hypothetical protein IJ435_03650 [Clostridia bacterium]|nr:hypothetical protein [Clostridia bacterium]
MYKEHNPRCLEITGKNALDLINRQKAEIERLQLEVEAVNELINPLPFKSNFDKAIETAKAEAIKEFAERLKRNIGFLELPNVVVRGHIDNIIKELTEEK